MPEGTYEIVDPLLEPKAKGVFRPRQDSPVVDTAIGDYPVVILDLDGQPRIGPKDRGADELSNEALIAEFLTPGAILRLIHGREKP